jgi:hypothetical protein
MLERPDLMKIRPASPHDPRSTGITEFLREQGAAGEFQLVPLPGGANNRVYRLPQPDGDWVLKCYFRSPADLRDRFGAERAFYEWVWSRGIRRTPEPIAWNPKRRLGLLTFVPGGKLRPDEVNARRIQEALDFLDELNASRHLPAAAAIPVAAEACFSIAEHLACIQRRVSRLGRIFPRDPVDHEAAGFIRQELIPAWVTIRHSLKRAAAKSGLTLSQTLPQPCRCLSPSDFGFHNAIVAPDQHLRFFDFEYAGWDDPAKLVCDFFCQPEIPVGCEHWDGFVEQVSIRVKADAGMAQRARLLRPAYQIKWCCILLNEFVRREQARRRFSMGIGLSANLKAAQLAKARLALTKAVELSRGTA